MFKPSILAVALAATFSPGLVAAQATGIAVEAAAPSYAQYLVDSTAAKHPELMQLEVRTLTPGTTTGSVIAARRGDRIGQPLDSVDLEVIKTGEASVETNPHGDQTVLARVPLVDINRVVVGDAVFTFPYLPGSGMDEDALKRAAQKIGDEMSRRILEPASLADPVRFDSRIPVDSYAQGLVDEALARHPDIEILAVHARFPVEGGTAYPIVASNIGRIGKPADAADLEVISSGNPRVSADPKGRRIEAKLPLRDARGTTIGALAVVYPWKLGTDGDAIRQRAEKIRDELAGAISGIEALYGPRPVGRAAPSFVVQAEEELNKSQLGNKQSLPMTKEVVSAGALQNAQEGYSEAVKNQAGVAPSSSKGSPSDTISIRGINLNPISNYRINGGLAVAGVMTVPTEDKERLETLKGANALMFGIASPAGIINLVTKRAMERDISTAQVSVNSFGQLYGGVDVGRRFGEQKQAGLRLNASGVKLENGVKDTDGHGEFLSLGGDWQATDRLSLQGDLEYYQKHTVLQAAVSLLNPVNGVVPLPRVPDPRNLLSGQWATFDGDTTNADVRADYKLDSAWKMIAEAGQSTSHRTRYVTRIGKYDPNTGANGTVTTSFQDQKYVNTFERAELLGKFNTWQVTHDLTLGVSASRRDAFTPAQNSATLGQKQNLYSPIELSAPVFTKPATSLPVQVSKDTGLYTYDTVGLRPDMKLLLGFRQTQSQQDAGTVNSSATVNSPAGGFLYDLTPTTTLFASYMKGLEDGAIAPVNAANANQILAPGISVQKELGLRNSYFRGVAISASLFDISRVNAVIDPVTNVFGNNGTIHYQGAETVIAWDVNPRWTINVAGQYLHAEQISPDPKINGLVPENTPRFIGNFFVTHRPAWLPGLSLNAGTSFVTQRYVTPQDQGTIPGYALFSAGAAYVSQLVGHRVAWQFSIDNLANKRYWNSAQQGTLGTGMDRSFKLSARIDL
jgi:iron complex outermembrane receptor protein